jgi:hypothetical protein
VDLVVLGGEPGDREGSERFVLGELGVAFGEPAVQVGVVLFEAGDLGVAGVDGAAGGVKVGKLLLELGLEVRVAAVEGGSGDPGEAGQGGGVAGAAGR